MKNKSKTLSESDNLRKDDDNPDNHNSISLKESVDEKSDIVLDTPIETTENDTLRGPDNKKDDQKGIKENEDSEKFFTFTFYKVDPKWRWLNEMGKDEAAREFHELLEAASKRMKIRTYSTLGLRHESEFMIWTISQSLENIQVLASKVYTTILGKYIEPVSTFLSLTRRSIYSNKIKLGYEMDQDNLQYVVVYPFIKSREWYLLPFERRKEMMEEHIKVGRKYPEILLNTTYSFGIADQDFMLAFETNSLPKFQNLIIDLRETEVSRYIIKDTPMIPCVRKNIIDIIKSLG